MSLNPSDDAARQAADSLYEDLRRRREDVFYDDRDERPGVKFKDADLVGFPIRVNVGGRALKEGKVEVVSRRDKSVRAVPLAEAAEAVRALRRELAGRREKDHARGGARVPLARPHGKDRGRPDEAVPHPARSLARLHPRRRRAVPRDRARPGDVYKYTAKGNLVAVITNGTAVLGLGNIGPLAGKPVMEGKGVLFKRFADIDVFDIEVDTRDPRSSSTRWPRSSRRSAGSTSRTSRRRSASRSRKS